MEGEGEEAPKFVAVKSNGGGALGYGPKLNPFEIELRAVEKDGGEGKKKGGEGEEGKREEEKKKLGQSTL